MDGFNAIPIDNNFKSSPKPVQNQPVSVNTTFVDPDIQITDDTKKVTSSEGKYSGLLFLFSILCLVGVIGYFVFLVVDRLSTIQKISILNEDFNVLSKSIDKKEIDDFLAIDNSLKSIKEKLSGHILLGNTLQFVNRNIRNTVQITDYKVETKDSEIVVNLVSIAPSFKELAEQTEKLSELKNAGELKSYSVNQLSLESDGRRVRFNLNIIFDKSKVSVLNLYKI